MTGFCRNMKHRPMKTVSEKYHQNPKKKESFCSSFIPPLNCGAVYGRNASFIFYKICYDDVFYSIK